MKPLPFDMTTNLPPKVPRVFEAAYREAMREILAGDSLADLFGGHSFNGTARDREAGAAFVARRLSAAPDPGRIVITNSTQSALLSLITGIVGIGGRLAVDQMTYPSIRQFSTSFGFALLPIAIDDEGMIPEDYEKACRLSPPRALYSTPTLQNPTTGIMSRARREAIIAISRRYGVMIIEDDIYSLLPLDQPPALADLAPDITWHVLGTTKGVAAGLKTCYVTAPSAAEAQARFWPGVRATYWMCAPANVTLVTRLIETHRIDGIIAAVRTETWSRQAAVAETFGEILFRAHPEGLHVWLPLPASISRRDFIAKLEQQSVKVAPSDLYAMGDVEPPNGIRFGTGKPDTTEALRQKVEIIAELYRQEIPGDSNERPRAGLR